MNTVKSKRIRHFLKLTYPLRVVLGDDEHFAEFPDLPGCACRHADLASLMVDVEAKRRAWVTDRVLTDTEIPLPNSYLRSNADRPTLNIT